MQDRLSFMRFLGLGDKVRGRQHDLTVSRTSRAGRNY
nr:hypothetical protein [Brucella sp. 458]